MDPFGVAFVPVLLAYAAVPAAIAVAVLRYRLYEIDRIISRTLSWATVSGVLVVVFAGLVVGLQALLTGVTQGQTLAVAASTLAAFALFQPVRRRVQRAVDRRFDRARYDGGARPTPSPSGCGRGRPAQARRSARRHAHDTVRGRRGLWLRGGRCGRPLRGP